MNDFDTNLLLREPLWAAEHLGRPIPDSPHAVSVCLPTWQDGVDYEEGRERVLKRLSTGYPRFVYNRYCRELFALCDHRFRADELTSLVFPSEPAARRFADQIEAENVTPVIERFGHSHAHVVLFPRSRADVAKNLWQHCGEGITSRQAEALLNETAEPDGTNANSTIRRRVADLYGVPVESVYLYPTGMAAIFAVDRQLQSIFPGRKSIQFGFPYVDTLKIQQKFGPGAWFFPRDADDEIERMESTISGGSVRGLYTEFPSNPLLTCPDLNRLADWSKRGGFPLIVDDTLGALINVDVKSACDVVTVSLTKFFSGAGDVTAGAVIVNPDSRFAAELCDRFNEENPVGLWGGDAVVLESNSRTSVASVQRINQTTQELVDWLRRQPAVQRVFYPSEGNENYVRHQKPSGGFGGLFSLLLEPKQAAVAFYDALRVSKGPNLGTHFTLACPYTILAHYQELEFAESCGVSRWLVRVSVGLEEPDDLIERFGCALAQVKR